MQHFLDKYNGSILCDKFVTKLFDNNLAKEDPKWLQISQTLKNILKTRLFKNVLKFLEIFKNTDLEIGTNEMICHKFSDEYRRSISST